CWGVSPVLGGKGATSAGGVVTIITSPACPGGPLGPGSPCGPCSQPIILTTRVSTRSDMGQKCCCTAMPPSALSSYRSGRADLLLSSLQSRPTIVAHHMTYQTS